jgi:hypothetical protein
MYLGSVSAGRVKIWQLTCVVTLYDASSIVIACTKQDWWDPGDLSVQVAVRNRDACEMVQSNLVPRLLAITNLHTYHERRHVHCLFAPQCRHIQCRRQEQILFFFQSLIACDLYRSWRCTHCPLPDPDLDQSAGGTLQAPLCPPPRPVPSRCKSALRKLQRKDKGKNKGKPSPNPTPLAQRP